MNHARVIYATASAGAAGTRALTRAPAVAAPPIDQRAPGASSLRATAAKLERESPPCETAGPAERLDCGCGRSP